jgi:hypothetical protein
MRYFVVKGHKIKSITTICAPSLLVLYLDTVSVLLFGASQNGLLWRRHIRHNQTVRLAVEYCTCISVVWRYDRWNKERHTDEQHMWGPHACAVMPWGG